MEETDIAAWKIRLADWWQLLREDFLIWRIQDQNKTRTVIAVSCFVGFLSIFLFWRLWKSRQRHPKQKKQHRYKPPTGAPTTALNKLESTISRKIGPRPIGLPLCRWVRTLEDIDSSLASITRPLTEKHSTLRFDSCDLKNETLEEISELCLELKKRIKGLSPVK